MNLKSKITQTIKIRPLTIEDYGFVLNWSKDEKFCLANGWEKDRNEEELYPWWINYVNNLSENFIRLGIEFKERLIGYVDLAYIKDNTAELGIAIGDSTLWGRGIGFSSTINMIEYAFKELGIRIFNAETHENNISSRRMLEKAGFQEISRIGTEAYLGEERQLIQYRLCL